MGPTVAPAEQITRYLRNSGHMRPGLQRPHFTAYMPQVADGDISVYRTMDLSDADIEALGAQHVGKPANPLKGHCCLSADAIFGEGLNIVSAPNPHPRHANVTGWVNDPKNRIIARKLADLARLTVYLPTTPTP